MTYLYTPRMKIVTPALLKLKKKPKETGLQLNVEKCEYHQRELKFLDHIISQHGVNPDPEKMDNIKKMAEPKDIPELRRFLGMVQCLGRYIKDLSTILNPLNELLQKETAWYWGPDQMRAFQTFKDRLTDSRALACFDTKRVYKFVQRQEMSYVLCSYCLQFKVQHIAHSSDEQQYH